MMKMLSSSTLFSKPTCRLVFLFLISTLYACTPPNANNFEFQVLVNNAQGYKVPNARVLLTYAGGTDSRLTDNNGKVSFFPDRQYLGTLATVQVEANNFKPYKSELKLSSSPQEIQIEQVAGDPKRPDGGKPPDPVNPQGNNSTTQSTPLSPTPTSAPKYPVLQPNITASGKIAENAKVCYEFAGTANTPLLFTIRSEGFNYYLEFFDTQERSVRPSEVRAFTSNEVPFTPKQDGQYEICLTAKSGFGTYVLSYEIYK